MSPEEIKRQEAIFELFQGESDVVEDLNMAKQVSFYDYWAKRGVSSLNRD